MDPIIDMKSEIYKDFPPFFKVYKDGSIQRYTTTGFVEPGLDTETGLRSKDVIVSPATGVKARIFLPKIENPDPNFKFPLLVHYHGGGFSLESPFSPATAKFLSALAAQASAITISTDYRLAPEHLLPIAFNDSLAALQWVALHSDGRGPDPWINQYADLDRVILIGESAGATIAQYVAVQAGATGLTGLKIEKLLVIHPYFGTREPSEYYQYISPTSSGADDDPKLNPSVDPDLLKLKCERILVCVAELDDLRGRGVTYFDNMRRSRWEGSLEFYETKGEGHVFFKSNPSSKNMKPFMNKLVDFIKQE